MKNIQIGQVGAQIEIIEQDSETPVDHDEEGEPRNEYIISCDAIVSLKRLRDTVEDDKVFMEHIIKMINIVYPPVKKVDKTMYN